MISPQASVAARLRELGVDEEIDFNTPPRPEMGDFSTPVALKLRKTRGGNPIAIAEELRAALSESLPPHIRDVRVTPPGFLNFFLDDRSYAADLLAEIAAAGEGYGRGDAAPGKTLIEHTNVNPNKAMHVGHVRNAVLGDTLVRALRWAGKTVEACNYIDDTGVQVVDVVTALLYLEPPFYSGDGNFDAIWAKVDPSIPFDHYCWNLYAAVQDYLRKGAADAPGSALSEAERERAAVLQQRKSEVMHGVEERGSAIAAFAKEFAERVVEAHLRTASRLNVYYNLMNWESDIIGRGFWNTTFDLLRSNGVIRYEESGLNRGCWVVPMGGIEETPDGPRSRDRILVRSNGLITYTAKDVAYQLWKFGRLDADFLFRLWGVQENGEELWTTSPEGTRDSRFGHASRVINVIDVGQSDPQTAVYECLERSGFPHEASCSIHLAYEKVMLSRSAAAELGVEIEEGQGLAMSGRKGLGVKASDLIDRMIGVIRNKNPDPTVDAEALAIAAIRYYMLRFSINTIIRFDFDVASQTNGETGVYLVYSFVRACSILSKAGGETAGVHPPPPVVPAALTDEEKLLLREMGRFGEAVQQAAETLTTTPLTTYAYGLASAFAGFFDRTPPVIREQDPAVRQFRLALVSSFRQVMKNTLEVLGIKPLDRI